MVAVVSSPVGDMMFEVNDRSAQRLEGLSQGFEHGGGPGSLKSWHHSSSQVLLD